MQKLLAELVKLVHDLSNVTLLDTTDTLNRHLFWHIPQINLGSFAFARGVCLANFNVKAVVEITINTTLTVNVQNLVLGTEAFAKGVLLNISSAHMGFLLFLFFVLFVTRPVSV